MSDASKEQQLEETIKSLRQENSLLRQKLDLLLRRMHGKSSEKLSLEHLDLFLENADASGKPEGGDPKENKPENVAPKPIKPRGKRDKPRVPTHLPVEITVIDPQAVLDNPHEWRRIGEEISEQLDFRPAQFVKLQLVRPKYVHLENRHDPPIIAPLPACWKERVIATPALQAHIAISKYADHLPLYRQESIYRDRHGVDLPRNTMARWMDDVASSLKLIYIHMIAQLRTSGYVQVDETPIKYLEPGSGKAQQGYFWAYSSPKGDVIFDWQTGRGHECLFKILHPAKQTKQAGQQKTEKAFEGILQCDGYSAYTAFSNKVDEVQLAGCWAHVRRKFHEAMESAPTQAGWIMRQIQHLYRIERRLRDEQASPKMRQLVREYESAPIVSRIKSAVMKYKGRPTILPKSALGMAVSYALSEWTKLEIYLHEGQMEIDNNLVENAIRPTAVGKKNWLFIGGAETGERSAIIYTLIESCRRRKIDPFAYLSDVLAKLATATTRDIPNLTPEAWARAQRVEVAVESTQMVA